MFLRPFLGAARRRILCRLGNRNVDLTKDGLFASFTFDDFPRTAWTAGGSIMRDCGVRGTYYVALSLMDTVNALGEQFHLEDLRALAEQGHEIGTHSFGHLSGRETPLQTFMDDVIKGYRVTRETMKSAVTGNFAYPYGDVTLRTKCAVGKVMRSCRGIYGGVNGPAVDLNLLRANRLYGDVAGLERIRRLIELNVEGRAWLIFYTHDVQNNPSPFGCTPKFLESAIRLAASHGAKVLPVNEVLSHLAPGTYQEAAASANQSVTDAVPITNSLS